MDLPVSATSKPVAIRQNSPIISSYPWQTLVLDEPDLASIFKNTCFEKYSAKVMEFEKIISSASYGDGLDLRKFLGFEREYKHLGHLQSSVQGKGSTLITSLPPKSKSVLSMLILAYRIMDAVAALGGARPDLPLRQDRFKSSGDFGRNLEFFERLNNWPDLLVSFTHAINSPPVMMADTLNSNIRAFIANENTSISNSNQETLINRHVAVLKNLVSAKRAIAALINVQMAVISLHRMLNEFQVGQTCGSTLSKENIEYLRSFCNSDKMELPLRLALFISPLLLLIPKCVHNAKGRMNLFEIMETGKALGNRRPPLLQRVEKEVLTSLFRLATEEVDLATEMKNCVGRMPWEALYAINQLNDASELSWFQPENGGISAAGTGSEGEHLSSSSQAAQLEPSSSRSGVNAGSLRDSVGLVASQQEDLTCDDSEDQSMNTSNYGPQSTESRDSERTTSQGNDYQPSESSTTGKRPLHVSEEPFLQDMSDSFRPCKISKIEPADVPLPPRSLQRMKVHSSSSSSISSPNHLSSTSKAANPPESASSSSSRVRLKPPQAKVVPPTPANHMLPPPSEPLPPTTPISEPISLPAPILEMPALDELQPLLSEPQLLREPAQRRPIVQKTALPIPTPSQQDTTPPIPSPTHLQPKSFDATPTGSSGNSRPNASDEAEIPRLTRESCHLRKQINSASVRGASITLKLKQLDATYIPDPLKTGTPDSIIEGRIKKLEQDLDAERKLRLEAEGVVRDLEGRNRKLEQDLKAERKMKLEAEAVVRDIRRVLKS